MHTRQNEVKSIDVLSLKSKSPDSNAAMILVVDIPAPRREQLSDELDWWQYSRGGGLLFEDE